MIKRLFHSLARWGQSHGFGVQSPFAYRFIKDVVRETYPYYAYQPLALKYPESAHSMAVHRFLLRLSNKLQASVWVSLPDPVDSAYIEAGCKKAKMYVSHPSPDVVVIDFAANDVFGSYDDLLSSLSPKSVLIVKNVHRSKSCLAVWKVIVSDARTGVSFDLYDCGVVFFDKKIPKRNYKVMLKG